jgi:hypothetical protein
MYWRKLFAPAALTACLALSACTSSQVTLDYQPNPGQMVKGAPNMAVGVFTNSRREGAFQLGTVRTPIGAPLENVVTRTPVEQVVANCFTHALSQRGMLASARRAKYVITGDVQELYCQMIVHPYGYARVRVNVVSATSGQIIFSRVYAGERQSVAYRPGSGSPVPLLRDLTSRALQDAVDRACDDPELRGRLRGDSPSYGAPPPTRYY